MSTTCPLCKGTGKVEIAETRYVTEHQRHQIKAMLEGGMTYRAVGLAIGKSAAVIYKHAQSMGINSKNIRNKMENGNAVAAAEPQE